LHLHPVYRAGEPDRVVAVAEVRARRDQDELAAVELQPGIAHNLGDGHARVAFAHIVGQDVQRLADELHGDRRGEAPLRIEAEDTGELPCGASSAATCCMEEKSS
jgi:hypothetical protein